MIIHTTNYTVTGSGTAQCETGDEYNATKASLEAAPDKFTITTDTPESFYLTCDMNITVNA